VKLHLVPNFLNPIFKDAFGSIKGIANGNINIAVSFVLWWVSINDHIFSGHDDVNLDMIKPVGMTMPVWARENNLKADNAIKEVFQFFDFLLHGHPNSVGFWKIKKCDLKGYHW
jgi:hypothetical protein